MILVTRHKDGFGMADWYLARATKISLMATGKTKEMALRNLKHHMKQKREDNKAV
jgi:hypothetical protein